MAGVSPQGGSGAKVGRCVDRDNTCCQIQSTTADQLATERRWTIAPAAMLETAQVLVGHARGDVTQVYAQRYAALAEWVALEVGGSDARRGRLAFRAARRWTHESAYFAAVRQAVVPDRGEEWPKSAGESRQVVDMSRA